MTTEARYGLGGRSDATPAEAGAGVLTDAGGQRFGWGTPRRAVVIQNISDGVALFIRPNGTAANSDNWVFCLQGGDPPLILDEVLAITHLQVFADGAATYGTHFAINGW